MLAFLVLSLAACGKSDKGTKATGTTENPAAEGAWETNKKAGDPCAEEGKSYCTGKSASIVCVDGVFEEMECRDGCSTRWSHGHECYPGKEYRVGEYCPFAVINRKDDWFQHVCSIDGKSQLVCPAKHWVHEKKCRGKKGCRWEYPLRTATSRGRGNAFIVCDDDFVEKGLPCPNDGKHVCTMDGKATLVCAAGAWKDDQFCRGPSGCRSDADKIRCDDTLAELGDPCDSDGAESCSVDKKTLLVCKSKKMVLSRPCKSGCAPPSDKVKATDTASHFDCK